MLFLALSPSRLARRGNHSQPAQRLSCNVLTAGLTLRQTTPARGVTMRASSLPRRPSTCGESCHQRPQAQRGPILLANSIEHPAEIVKLRNRLDTACL